MNPLIQGMKENLFEGIPEILVRTLSLMLALHLISIPVSISLKVEKEKKIACKITGHFLSSETETLIRFMLRSDFCD